MTVSFDEVLTQRNGQQVQAPRRLRGLRFPVLPTGSWLAQVGGAAAALTGVYLQWGVATALIVGGVASVVVGSLREAGKV